MVQPDKGADDNLDRLADLRVTRRRLLQHCCDDGRLAVAGKRGLPRRRFVEHQAEGENVAARVRGAPL